MRKTDFKTTDLPIQKAVLRMAIPNDETLMGLSSYL